MAREPQKSRQNTGKSNSETGAKTDPSEGNATQKQGADSEGAAEFLKRQHQELRASLAKRSETEANHPNVVKEFAVLWLPHQAVEAEILAPALRDSGWDQAKTAESEVRKDIINILLADLLQNEDNELVEAKLDRLASEVDALVEAASGEDDSAQKAVAAAEAQFPLLNSQLATRYEGVKQRFADMDESIGEALVMLAPRRLSVSFNSQPSRREYQMSSRYSDMRERDEQGRFTSEDDHRGSSGGRGRDEEGRFMSEGGRLRGRYNDDDRDYRGSRGGPERDENGRFMSEGGRSSSRYNDDDRDYRGSRGGPERGDNGRFMSEGGSRSRGRYDEDERYGRGSMSRSRDDEGRFARGGGGSEGRGHGGWFGDSEGHSEASRRGWESGSHGDSGWYGDRQGHSEARGGDGKIPITARAAGMAIRKATPRRPVVAGNMAMKAITEADRLRVPMTIAGTRAGAAAAIRTIERGGNGGRSGNGDRGGWSGDPEGHSEASRRGWQNRR